MAMTYEEIMSINAGDVVNGGYSMPINATYIGPGESILDADGNVAPGGHRVNKWDGVVVLDIGYSKQLILIQYPAGSEIRQGYISTDLNSLTKLEFCNLEANFWQNGSTSETVYLSYTGEAVLGTIDPHEKAVFLYKVNNRYNVAYTTSKGPYTKAGFVNYSGGISQQTTQDRCLVGGDDSVTNIPAGAVVPGGRTYAANAISQENQTLTDVNGNGTGHSVSIGDELTVLDISYSRQRALVQYPAGNEIRQGYIVNDPRFIVYKNPYTWVNGSSKETVYSDIECTHGHEFGTIDEYEAATVLYEKDGKKMVVYDAYKQGTHEMEMQNKNGFVKFVGNKPQTTPSANDLLYQGFAGNVEKIPYGTSPLGHPLNVYKIGSGSNVLFANFAIHGFEDDWNHDGTALVTIANELIRKISATDNLHGWTVYVNNCANPDGTFNGITNDGPGRCTVTSRIDMNRCFPGMSPRYNSRNYTGNTPLGAPEAVALKNIVEKIHSEHINGSNEMVVLDFHGWMGMTQGNQEIGKYFNAQFNGGANSDMVTGFFSVWAENSLGSTRAVLVEYPKYTRSITECISKNYSGRTYNAIMNLLSNNQGSGSSSSSNGSLENGSTGNNVRVIQQDLRGLGYGINTIDGNFGTETENAVKTFQKDNGLYVDGIVGNSTMSCVKQKVEYVQTLLNKAGYTFGSVDGYFGADTKSAVERFQTDAKLYVDGIVGNSTLTRLKECADKSSGSGNSNQNPVNGELRNGSTGSDVRVIQQDLRGLGYGINTIDGSFGLETESAVKTFQRDNGLYVDGIVGNSTMSCIKQKVEYVQNLLNKVGYTFGNVDGYFGNDTKSAVERFQRDAKLDIDGIVGNETLTRLKECADKSSSGGGSNPNPASEKNTIYGKYLDIVHEFGFSSSNKLSNGSYVKSVGIANGQFELGMITDILPTNKGVLENSILILNGEAVALTTGIDALTIPFGKEQLNSIIKILDNGLIGISINNRRMSISITKIENGAEADTTLTIDIYLVEQGISTVEDSWQGVLDFYKKKTTPNYTIAEKVGIIGESVCAIILGVGMVASFGAESLVVIGAIGEGSLEESTQEGLEESITKEFGEADKYTEILENMRSEFVNDLKEAKVKFKPIIDQLYKTGKIENKNSMNKLCVVRDITDRENPEKVAIGGSGQYFNNPTIFTDNASEVNIDKILFPNQTLEGDALKAEFTEQSEKTLTDQWVRTVYGRNYDYYSKKGISLDDLLGEFKLLKDKIQRVKNLAQEVNKYGNSSFQKDWNIENCAEIWAYRNGLLLGIKGENIVMRCVFYSNLKYAKPCLNCMETFAVEINEGRDLLGN